MSRLTTLTVALLFTANVRAADFVWIEGEAPTSKNLDVKGAGAGNAHYLSQQTWLDVNLDPAAVGKVAPEDGILLGYEFQAPSAGKYEVWNRIGMEFVRSPFEWRIDQSAWRDIQPTDLTTDLMELSLWTESGVDQDG